MPPRIIPIAAEGRSAPAGLAVLPPLSLYVHFPWCVRKCPYCDFNSHEISPPRSRRFAAPSPQGAKQHLGRPGVLLPQQEAAYLAALIADLEQSLPLVWGRPVISVFIGGGTPSLLAPESVDALLSAVRARLTLQPDAEITLEANPGTVEAGRFAAFRAAGVNRLSIGVQSLNPVHLAALGRIHDAAEARRAVELALKHFDNVNIDMMYALPGQTLEEARTDIREAAAFGSPHLSAYHLTLEPNTAFHRAPPPLPDDDLAAQMQDAVEDVLASFGYDHYEISAFARPGSECRHNLNYWLFGDYLGIGAGAHGKISSPVRIVRQVRHKHPQAFLQAVAGGNAVQEAHEVGAADLPFEFMMNALRLRAGFPPRLFAERTGLALDAIRPQLDAAAAGSLLAESAVRIAPTEHGRRFLNDLLQAFLRN